MLWGAALLPLAFWPPFEDAFKLPQTAVIWVVVIGALLFLASRTKGSNNQEGAGIPLGLAGWVIWFGRDHAPLWGLLAFGGLIASAALSPRHVKRSTLARIPIIMVVAGVVSAGYSLAQFAGLDFSGAPGGAGLRPFSTMGNPDFLAAYLIAVLPVAVAWWLAKPTPLRFGSCLVLIFGLLLAQSRGAWIGMVVSAVAGIALVGWGRLRAHQRIAGGAALLVVILAGAYFMASAQARERLAQTVSIRHFDASGRLFMWRSTLGLIRQSPLHGGGLGTFGLRYPAAHAATALAWPGMNWFWSENSHNDYLQLASDIGLIGLGLFAWIWSIFVRSTYTRWHNGDPLALGTLLGFVAVQADAFFNFPWYLLPVQAWFWFSWAATNPNRLAFSEPTVRRERLPWLLVAMLAGIFGFGLAIGNALIGNRWLKLSGDFVAAQRWTEARGAAEQSMCSGDSWENPQRAANNAALAAYSMGDFPAAEAYARRSLAWFPDQPGALNQLGLALARQGKTAEAGEAARRALALNPRQAESWHLLGNLAYLAGDTRSAAAYWTAALRENPNLPGLRESLAALARGDTRARRIN